MRTHEPANPTTHVEPRRRDSRHPDRDAEADESTRPREEEPTPEEVGYGYGV